MKLLHYEAMFSNSESKHGVESVDSIRVMFMIHSNSRCVTKDMQGGNKRCREYPAMIESMVYKIHGEDKPNRPPTRR